MSGTTWACEQDAAGVVEGVDVEALAERVNACPAVAQLGSGLAGGVTTYLPGKRVGGLRVEPDAIEVEVVGLWPAAVQTVVAQVRQAVSAVAPGRQVHVSLADVRLPAEAPRIASRPEESDGT